MIRFATRQIFTVVTLLVFAALAPAQHLRQFSLNGTSQGKAPSSGLVQDSQGNFYGATNTGGAFGAGEVYQITTAGSYTPLYSFGASSTDGVLPQGNLVIDQAGNLYGVTMLGGTAACDCGAVFEISPPAQPGNPWTETLIYSFQGEVGGGSDGTTPLGGLTFDSAGNLYGTTSSGGCSFGCTGSIYELSPQPGGTWTETILFAFGGFTGDAKNPACTLVIDPAGNIYGTTQMGGLNDRGTVFEISPPSQPGGAWTEALLHSFYGPPGTDGAFPIAGLTLGQGSSVALFGITSTSPGFPEPTFFVMLPPPSPGGNWLFIPALQITENIGSPEASLVWAGPITLFGTGTGVGGTVFELSIANKVASFVASFNFQSVIQNLTITTPVLVGNHALFGTSSNGGTGNCDNGAGCGTVFQLTP